MSIKTMTLDEVRNLPPLTDAEIAAIEGFDEKFDDPECPVLDAERLKKARRLSKLHPEWFENGVAIPNREKFEESVLLV